MDIVISGFEEEQSIICIHKKGRQKKADFVLPAALASELSWCNLCHGSSRRESSWNLPGRLIKGSLPRAHLSVR
ncbi:uncharacterized protein G2W53_016272 [Senna tora]|uniref:Uncharacterized protein n=1 Tax=Senna tora TaxID=362788 RepID=A0A834WLC7_9FABA|nr:uncharacterized protein G2W53_016272 [Senna tora]